MIRKSNRVAQLILVTSALGLATVASAALKDKPPKGVTLAGTGWLIDPYRSDDPNAVIEKAEKERQDAGGGHQGGMNRGVFGGGDGPWGGGEDHGGTWGGGSPDGEGRPSVPRDLPGGRAPSGGRGGWGHDQGGTSTDVDPTGSSQSASVRWGSGGGAPGNAFLTQLTKNPDTLTFLEVNQHLKVSADKVETECAAGTKVAISDSYGDGERSCGWDGRAWVVETTRGKHFTRTDRYELSKDGKTLTYVTTASGTRMPKIRISRTYTVAPPTAPG